MTMTLLSSNSLFFEALRDLNFMSRIMNDNDLSDVYKPFLIEFQHEWYVCVGDLSEQHRMHRLHSFVSRIIPKYLDCLLREEDFRSEINIALNQVASEKVSSMMEFVDQWKTQGWCKHMTNSEFYHKIRDFSFDQSQETQEITRNFIRIFLDFTGTAETAETSIRLLTRKYFRQMVEILNKYLFMPTGLYLNPNFQEMFSSNSPILLKDLWPVLR
jgi:hypothetical protein